MEIRDTVTKLTRHFYKSRRMGYTSAILNIVKNSDANFIILSHSEEWARVLKKEGAKKCVTLNDIGVGKLEGENGAILIDNAALTILFQNILNEFENLDREIIEANMDRFKTLQDLREVREKIEKQEKIIELQEQEINKNFAEKKKTAGKQNITMSKKVTIEDVKDVLLGQGFDQSKVNNAIEELKAIIEEEAENKPKEKKAKSRFYVWRTLSQLTEEQKAVITEVPLQVVKVRADIPHTSVIEHISAAIRQSNLEQEGKKKPKIVSSIFSGLERLSARYFKTEGVSRLSKEVVMLVETDNQIIIH